MWRLQRCIVRGTWHLNTQSRQWTWNRMELQRNDQQKYQKGTVEAMDSVLPQLASVRLPIVFYPKLKVCHMGWSEIVLIISLEIE
eukprot:762801-Amphidinium_carterae.1